jgi:hypothetical protein
MSQLKSFTYEGAGEFLTNFLHYAQAVRVGDQLQLSGQGKSPAPPFLAHKQLTYSPRRLFHKRRRARFRRDPT